MNTSSIEQIEGIPVVHVHVDIDAATAGSIQAQLDESLGPDALTLIVDLAQTNYVDSAGIDMLVRLNDRLLQRRATLTLVIPPDAQINRLVQLVGLDQVVAIQPTVPAALRDAAQLRRSNLAPEDSEPPRS